MKTEILPADPKPLRVPDVGETFSLKNAPGTRFVRMDDAEGKRAWSASCAPDSPKAFYGCCIASDALCREGVTYSFCPSKERWVNNPDQAPQQVEHRLPEIGEYWQHTDDPGVVYHRIPDEQGTRATNVPGEGRFFSVSPTGHVVWTPLASPTIQVLKGLGEGGAVQFKPLN